MSIPLMNARFEVVDVTDFFRRLGTLEAATRIQIIKGLQDHTEEVFRQSQEQVPVKTGALRASAILEPARAEGNTFVSGIRYTRDYALRVHENRFINYKHGKAGFLSDPINEQAPELLNRIGKRIKEIL